MPSDYDPYHYYDEETMYHPLGVPYIPVIHPSNLSFVTPSPETYKAHLQKAELQNVMDYYQNMNKTDHLNAQISNMYNNSVLVEEPIDQVYVHCPFIDVEDHRTGLKAGAYWIYAGTILLLLACNIIFLVWIMKVGKL